MTFLGLIFVSLFILANINEVLAAPTTYNQQQNGDLNIRIDLKDIEIVAIVDSGGLEDYGDYDISYDYTDFTIKPIISRPTTASPVGSNGTSSTSTTVKPWHTWPTISPTSSTPSAGDEDDNSSPSLNSTTEKLPVDDNNNNSSRPESKTEKNADDEQSDDNSNSGSVIAALLSSAVAEGIPIRINPPSDETPTTEETLDINLKKIGVSDDIVTEKYPITDISGLVDPQTSSPDENQQALDITENSEAAASTEQTLQHQKSKKCRSGYAKDQKGQCRRIHGRRRVPSSLLP